MSFKMRCPKCKSFDYSIERDRWGHATNDDWVSLIFACRCGKQMFGTQIRDEYDRQRRRAESKSSRPEPTSAPVEEDEEVEVGEDVPEEEKCAWHQCDNRSRSNSKYCSRACSNKNARWRHKQRKREKREDDQDDEREAA